MFWRLQRGNQAEKQALSHLRQQGLKLCETNYRCKFGEIDLIMSENQQLVFVEVRLRSHPQVSALESVDRHKQQRLIRTAKHYLQQKALNERCICRFDVVAFTQLDQPPLWIRDAFTLPTQHGR